MKKVFFLFAFAVFGLTLGYAVPSQEDSKTCEIMAKPAVEVCNYEVIAFEAPAVNAPIGVLVSGPSINCYGFIDDSPCINSYCFINYTSLLTVSPLQSYATPGMKPKLNNTFRDPRIRSYNRTFKRQLLKANRIRLI